MISKLCLSVIFFFLLSLSSAATVCNPSDQKALLKLSKDLSAAIWDPKTTPDCCTNWSGVGCDTNGRVTSLTLNLFEGPLIDLGPQPLPTSIGGLPFLETIYIHANLTGTIPDSMINLANLQRLHIDTGLSGPIPNVVSRLNNLTSLDLSSNAFTGSIPSSLGQLTRLTFLKLSFNQLSGPIPPTLGRLTKLKTLDLSINQLTGLIPASLSDLKEITRLDLGENRLTGSIPDSFGSFTKRSLLMYLRDNQLSGPIPRSVGQGKFELLDVTNNFLTGDVSFLFGRDKTWVRTINLAANRFKFDFSNVEFPPRLTVMYVNNNELYGSLPEQLGNLPLVVGGIDVSNNHLCGRIPTGRHMKYLGPNAFANNTCLCGTPLPPCK